ncbi:hypothetical protein [Streptomyces botrytidirepellens]|uniref:Uncharacterized protein n=1 Tax=Streptomyces botrytidirepellens TaxID=2486417 RepID=A0A3M8WT99_9ACTN|nr:hypothetical protein [Streptomyces botrytidirepellens]RNG32957.1 hypothetical protein EEJ42_07550 [Streptomyces botrytidirepellens]
MHASTPRLTSQPHQDPGHEPVCGLRFTEDTPRTGQARTRGTVVITLDGILAVRAYTTPGHRWLTALQHLGDLHPHALRPGAPTTAPADSATPSWSLRPHLKNRSLFGHLQPAEHVQAHTLTELPDTNRDVSALLTVTPDNRAACPAAWLLAVGFFHVLTTGAPPAGRP